MMPEIAPVARRRVEEVGTVGGGPWPFGLGVTKPKHFREMLKAAWRNRDNLGYGWKVLSQGVCDGCALGVAGFHDWTIDGFTCVFRAEPASVEHDAGVGSGVFGGREAVAGAVERGVAGVGAAAVPDGAKARGPRVSAGGLGEALGRIGGRLRVADPRRVAFFVTSRGVTNEVYYMAQKVHAFWEPTTWTTRRGCVMRRARER